MNVGLIIYGSLDIVTGGFLYDRKLVEYLRSKGDHVEIFSLPWRNYAAHLADNLSFPLRERLRSSRLDVLLQDELNHPSLIAVNRGLKSTVSYPMISIVHHLRCSEARPQWQNSLYSVVERQYLAGMDGFVFNSHTTRSTVEALVGDHRPWTVAHPGRDNIVPDVNRATVESRAVEPGPLRILFVGSLIHRKNLHMLVRALELLPEECWQLTVVGSLETDPAYARSIREKLDRNGLYDRVSLLGTLTGEDLAQQYRKSHMLAVPSSYEGFGIVYLEGMGFGLPALASNAGAAHEIVTHGLDGFLVDSDDPESMADRIHGLYTDRHELIRMSAAARHRYDRHPTWTDCAATIRRYLLEMVA